MIRQTSICAERCCTVDFRARRYDHVQPLLRSLYTGFGFLNGFRSGWSASVSLSPRLCTRLPGVRSSTRLRPRRTSATTLVVYVSARRPTHGACYHRRPSLPGGCCICLEQFAEDSTFIAVTTSFPQKTEDWTFCPVLQLFCLMNVSLYWLLCDPTLLLSVLAVLGLYATSSQVVIIIINLYTFDLQYLLNLPVIMIYMTYGRFALCQFAPGRFPLISK